MSDYPQHGLHPNPDSLSAFAEGVLPEHERVACLAHLAECEACREVVFLAQEPLPISVADRIVWWRRWLAPIPALSVAAVAGVLVLSVAIYRVERPVAKPITAVVAVAPMIPPPEAPRRATPAARAARKPAPVLSTPRAAAPPPMDQAASESFLVNGSLSAGGKTGASGRETVDSTVGPTTANAESALLASPAPVPSAMMARRGPLAKKTAAVTSVKNGEIMLRADSAGALYRSDDAGKKWLLMEPVWTGKVVELAAIADGSFRLTTESGAIWLSPDGVNWSSAK
jgi:pyruvate/2-oxoglutarate dehydrogenase complex dihydrolipoamide acyltransferase (E2) component